MVAGRMTGWVWSLRLFAGVVWKGTVGRSFSKVDAKEEAGRVSIFFNAGGRAGTSIYTGSDSEEDG